MSVNSTLIKLGNGCFAHGQLYTALSRCRSLKNLRIDRNICAEDIIINSAVVDFYSSIENPEPQKETIRMDIPAQYQDAVQELLRKLMAEKQSGTKVNLVKQESNKVTNHPDLDRLVIVYKNQTSNEKGEGITEKKNGVGFNKHDAPILTSIAENYIECGFVYNDDFAIASRLIQKYHAQWEV